MREYVIFFIVILFSALAQATVDESFNDGLNTAKQHQNMTNNALNHFVPEDTFKDYTANLPEGKYFQEGTTSTPLEDDAVKALPESETGQTVYEGAKNRPEFHIDPDSPELKDAKFIQKNAVEIVNGISNEFVDCTKEKTCTTKYENEVCEETPKSVDHFCKKILSVDMVPHQVDTRYILRLTLKSKHHQADVNLDAVTGKIRNISKDATASLKQVGMPLPNEIDCQSLHATQQKISNAHHTEVKNGGFSLYCDNGRSIIHLATEGESKNRSEITIQIDIVSVKIEFEQKDRWNDSCIGLAHNPMCIWQSEECLEPDTTHIINDIPVKRECWIKELHYSCGPQSPIDTCQVIREKGCEQIDSVCESTTDDRCTLFKKTFRCPIKTCTENSVVCNGETFCLTDDCFNHTKPADPDFQKAVSAISAIKSASKSFDEQYIFTGTKKSCSEKMIGFANCCSEKGWGIDFNLTECTQEEKDLEEAKKNKLAVEVGRYCDKDVLGICISDRKAYCVFPDMLGRIVQEQGRKVQLRISFGNGEHPNCRGITPDELQRIHFDAIDFSDFYATLASKEKIEDPEWIKKRIKDNINPGVRGGNK